MLLDGGKIGATSSTDEEPATYSPTSSSKRTEENKIDARAKMGTHNQPGQVLKLGAHGEQPERACVTLRGKL